MNSQTNSNSAPDAPDKQEPTPFMLSYKAADEPMKIKCKTCDVSTTHWSVSHFAVGEGGLPVGEIRVLMCGECGSFKTSR